VARKATGMPASMASIPVPLALPKHPNCGTLPTWKALTLKYVHSDPRAILNEAKRNEESVEILDCSPS
jgi:hypothetical protein